MWVASPHGLRFWTIEKKERMSPAPAPACTSLLPDWTQCEQHPFIHAFFTMMDRSSFNPCLLYHDGPVIRPFMPSSPWWTGPSNLYFLPLRCSVRFSSHREKHKKYHCLIMRFFVFFCYFKRSQLCKSSPFTIASEHAPRLSVVKEEGLENFSPAPAEGDVMTNADGVCWVRETCQLKKEKKYQIQFILPLTN